MSFCHGNSESCIMAASMNPKANLDISHYYIWFFINILASIFAAWFAVKIGMSGPDTLNNIT